MDIPTPIQGGLIGIEPDGIVGWARNRDAPDAPVQVRLMAGGQVVGQAVANQFDDPRVRTLVGPGVPGFIARLSAAPAASYPLLLSVHDVTGLPLGAPLPVHAAAQLAPLVGLVSTGSFDGSLDGVFNGVLKGWARDAAAPEAVVHLELLDGGAPIARTRADQLREDLRQAGLHGGMYGYGFDLPVSLLDGRPHSLSVRVAGTGFVLRGGPIAFGPLATSVLLTQVSTLQQELTALRMLVDGLVAPDGGVQRRIMRMLAERLAAQGEIQREQMERDMAALRAMVFAAAERASGAGPEQYGPKSSRRRR